MNYQRFLYYQSIISIAGSMIFPFYVLLLNNVGNSYSQFGWAYGLFALTSALAYPVIGRLADRLGDSVLFATYSWSMAVILLFLPLMTEVWHVYVLQIIMGLLGAVQRNSEKTSLARNVSKETAGIEIGKYHVWTSAGAAIAIILTGYLIDFLTIGSIFYIASLLYAVSGFMLLKKGKQVQKGEVYDIPGK
ncbi:MFS transporter [Bacillus sp. CECT 9360]|uniref:MFS transporter n=1 Tax=Bacillus sp. CECT 9360 TaxID=2845821 RepID=UPI001E4AEEA6|nr:MFS transporter [Bacillus sp. CECT 9360]CAH0346588.1 Multidrug resistance protein MdtG [Bacillus sp. CECT 9360]